MAAVVIVAAGSIAAAVYGVAALRGGSDDSRMRAFFTLPTRTSCGAGDLAISVEDTHFAAFVAGGGLTSKQGKFLIVRFTISGGAPGTALHPATDFVLAEASGRRYAPVIEPRGAPATPGLMAAQELLFDVPQTFGAAKLVFDDGCGHREWIVP